MRPDLILIASAFLHSSWNFIFKKLSPKNSVMVLIVFIATLFSICLTPLLGGFHLGSNLGLVFIFVAGLFEAGYFYSLSKSYETAPFGIAYSIMRGGAMVIVFIVSVMFLNEPFSPLKMLGLFILSFGIFLAPSRDSNKLERAGLLWAVSCAFFIAGYHLFYGLALDQGVSQVALFVLSMFISLPFIAFRSRAQALKDMKLIEPSKYIWIIIAGILSAGSFILFLYGLKETHPGVAISLRNTSILFSQGFALWLGEKLTIRQWLGVGGIFIGAMLISH